MFTPAIHGLTTMMGMESGINAFLLVTMLSVLASFEEKVELKKVLLLSGLAVLTLFSRLDNIFFILAAGIWLVFRKSALRWQILLDLIFSLLSALVAYYLRVQNTDNIFNFLPFAYLFIALSIPLKVLLLYAAGSYTFTSNGFPLKSFLRSGFAISVASAVNGLLLFLLHDVLHVFLGFPRSVVAIDLGFSLIFLVGWRVIHYLKMRLSNHSQKEDISLNKNWKQWLYTAIVYYFPMGLFLVAYLLWNKSYAGTSMPVSGQIKRWWGTLPLTVYGRPLKHLLEVLGSWFNPTVKNGPWWLVTKPVDIFTDIITRIAGFPEKTIHFTHFKRDLGITVWVVIGGIVFWLARKHRSHLKKVPDKLALLPFFTGCVFHIFSYKATGYLHAKYWYWTSEMLFAVIVGSILLECMLQNIRQNKHGGRVVRYCVAVLCVILIANLSLSMIQSFPYQRGLDEIHSYRKETEFIVQNTESGAIIGMTGGGTIAYFSENRIIVNLDGLVNGFEYSKQLQKAEAYLFLDKIGMDYVYAPESMILESDPYGWIFMDRLEPVIVTNGFNLYVYHSLTAD
jgi:hypothetical protein